MKSKTLFLNGSKNVFKFEIQFKKNQRTAKQIFKCGFNQKII